MQGSHICHRCGKRAVKQAKLSWCDSCKHARYCSQSCQRSDWRSHKAVCKEIREVVATSGGLASGKTFALRVFMQDALQVRWSSCS